MLKIGIFASIHATSDKPHPPPLFIHLDHTSHDPLAFGYLIFHLAGVAVIKIKVVPAIAF